MISVAEGIEDYDQEEQEGESCREERDSDSEVDFSPSMIAV